MQKKVQKPFACCSPSIHRYLTGKHIHQYYGQFKILEAQMASHPDTKIDCAKVYVKRSSFASVDNEFDGAFAAVAIKQG